MFFFFSKILAFIIAPYTWLFIGLLILLKKVWSTPYKKWVLAITIFSYVISNSFLVDEARAYRMKIAEFSCVDDDRSRRMQQFYSSELSKLEEEILQLDER